MIEDLENIIKIIDDFRPTFPSKESKIAFYWNITSTLCVGSFVLSLVVPENKNIFPEGELIADYLKYTAITTFGGLFIYKFYNMFKNICSEKYGDERRINPSAMVLPKFKKNYINKQIN